MTRKERILFIIRHRLKLIRIEFLYHKKILTSQDTRKYKLKHIGWMLFRRCPREGSGCGGGYAYIKHSNCAYVEELSNYNYCCKVCHEEIDAMYQEWWDEYNASRY